MKRNLEEQVLPDLFLEAGIATLSLPNGTKAKLSGVAVGSLPKDPALREQALAWLVENGYGDLVKAEVSASWGTGERDAALAAYNTLRGDNSAKVAYDETIHSATLGKLVKDRLAEGQPTPTETLGVSIIQKVRLTIRRGGGDE